MAADNFAYAYDFDLFDNTKNRKPSSAAEETAVPVKPHVVKAKPRTKKELKKEARYSSRISLKVMCLSVVLLLLAGSLIYCRVVLDELETKANELQTRYSEAQSENIRLESAVDSMYSINNISSYAEEKLGMIKKDSYQVSYYSVGENSGEAN